MNQISEVTELSRTLIDDIFKAFGLGPQSWARRVLGPTLWTPAQRLSELGVRFDEIVARYGLRDASGWVLKRFVKNVEVRGFEHIPREGPLLIVSNHPGTVDSLAITSNIPRDDVKIVVNGFGFLRRLPATACHLILTTLEPYERMEVVRSMIHHLRDGGSLLIFPRGTVEPDPAILPGAETEINEWSPSIGLLLKKVPQTQLLVTIVSGVLGSQYVRHPLTWLRKAARERQKLAEVLQMVEQLRFARRVSLTPRVSFGEPVTMKDFGERTQPLEIFESIIEDAKKLLYEHTALLPQQYSS